VLQNSLALGEYAVASLQHLQVMVRKGVKHFERFSRSSRRRFIATHGFPDGIACVVTHQVLIVEFDGPHPFLDRTAKLL
jgi:hypothetical protein